MNALKNLADKLCSHPKPALRPFDNGDWQAFNGCESDNPEIAYTERSSTILDGSTVEVVVIDDPDGYSGKIHVREFPTPEEARKVAEFLVINPELASTLLVFVGHT